MSPPTPGPSWTSSARDGIRHQTVRSGRTPWPAPRCSRTRYSDGADRRHHAVGGQGLDLLEGMGAENHARFGPRFGARGTSPHTSHRGVKGSAASRGRRSRPPSATSSTTSTGRRSRAPTPSTSRTTARGPARVIRGLARRRHRVHAAVGLRSRSISGQVHVWQGAHDRMVPFAHGEWLVAHLPGACAHLHAEHGHMSLAVGAFPAIVDALVDGT